MSEQDKQIPGDGNDNYAAAARKAAEAAKQISQSSAQKAAAARTEATANAAHYARSLHLPDSFDCPR